MGWTITSWQPGADWSSAAVLDEFRTAQVERRHVSTSASNPIVSQLSAGDDAQNYNWWLTLQGFIEQVVGDFVVSHDSGVKRAVGYFDNTSLAGGGNSFGHYSDLADLFSHMGLGYSDWRRYVDAPPAQGGTVQYGSMQQGDIIGHWLFEDLMTAFNGLIWTEDAFSSYVINGYEGIEAGEETWAGAKAGAEADYGLDASGYTAQMEATAYGQLRHDGYRAVLTREYGKGVFAIPPSGYDYAATVDCYWLSEDGGGVYDNQGDDLIEDKLSFSSSVNYPSGTGPSFDGDTIGDATKPAWCSEPNGGSTKRGYYTNGGHGLWRWTGFSSQA